MDRRRFLQLGLLGAGAATLAPGFLGRALAVTTAGDGPYGPLLAPDANGIRLPAGFSSRVLARSGQVVPGTAYPWHVFPDGGAVFPATDGGWIYVSNSEIPFVGGVGALRFDTGGEVIDAYRVLAGTSQNCAGGPTPWGTWLSCEEHDFGRVWECDPTGLNLAAAKPALGTFAHEAAAVDPIGGHVYLTEDKGDGRFYRFTPESGLDTGRLEAMAVGADGSSVTWLPVPDPNPGPGETPTRAQVPGSTAFNGGEGCCFDAGPTDAGIVYFTTKGDSRVWAYSVDTQTLELLHDGIQPLTGVDNVTVAHSGDIYVAEDAGDMQICGITPDDVVFPLLQVMGHARSEVAGPAFDPSGTRLYFSSQRGPEPVGPGITYEVAGPFR